MSPVTTNMLAAFEALKEVPAPQLQWLIDNSRQYILPEGDFLFKPGTPIVFTHFILRGRIKMYQLQHNEILEIAHFDTHSIAGYLPFSRGKQSVLYGEAREDTEIMSLPIEKSTELIRTHFELTQALVHCMTTRVREYTSLQLQNEKMMALGKLSAGLAHELNNPASAVLRGARSLKDHLKLVPDTFKQIMSIQMKPEYVDLVKEKLFSAMQQKNLPTLSLMERTDKEEELLDWLEEHRVANAGELAENFVEFGLTIADLDWFHQYISTTDLSAVFNWINTNLVTERMVTDIEEASSRIATLINSVKSFTHMDRGHNRQLIQVHEGIESTLVMLQHKLKKGNVAVERSFLPELPAIQALPGELNQVWTNLLDNALDAMEGQENGTINISTAIEKECIQVTITDNGPGIPADIQSRIFDPFFTTKSIGKGTGLGLDIVNQIIRQHNGSIKLNSRPGHTSFTVSLPMRETAD